MFETQKSGNKTRSGEIGLDIRTHASPKVGQDWVSGGVSVLCWHAAVLRYPWMVRLAEQETLFPQAPCIISGFQCLHGFVHRCIGVGTFPNFALSSDGVYGSVCIAGRYSSTLYYIYCKGGCCGTYYKKRCCFTAEWVFFQVLFLQGSLKSLSKIYNLFYMLYIQPFFHQKCPKTSDYE